MPENTIYIFLKGEVLPGGYIGIFEYFREKQNGTRGKAGYKTFHIIVEWRIYKIKKLLTCQEVCDECFAGRGDVFVVRSRHFHLVHVVVNIM